MRLWCYSPRFIVMRTFTWPIALLLAGLLFQTVAFAVLNTVVPLWMEQFDAATWEAGLVGAFFFLGNLAGTLLAGGVIRRAGFKGSYQYACLLCAVSTVLLPVFPGVPAWSGLRLLAGISCALVWVVVESALLRAGTLQTRGILLASYMVVYYLGTVLGQLLLGWFPSDMPLIVTEVCILSVAGMVPLMFARLEPGNGQVSSSSHIEIRTLLRRRSVFLGVVGCVISGVVLGTIYCLMPLFLKHQGMDHSSVGYWMALLIAAAILGQWPMGRLADRYGRAFVMKCQSLLVAAACAGLMLKGGLMAPSLIALGLEPEPFGHFHDTDGAIRFFNGLRNRSRRPELIERHLGLTYDTCHFAILREEPEFTLSAWEENNITLCKVQFSNALECRICEVEDLERLRQFDDGVYFHQTSILHREGAMLFPDLPNALAYGRDYAEEIRDSQWRIHYHIPLYASPEPPLKSTEEFIQKTHNFLRGRKGPQPHLEVETYTWSVLPDHMKIPLAAQIARELHYIETL